MEIIKIETTATDLRIDKPGIYEMTKDQYLADPCAAPSLSRSCIVAMLKKSPLHAAFDHPRIGAAASGGAEDAGDVEQEKENTARLIGDYVDEMMMDGRRKFCVLPFDKWTTKEAKEARAAALARGETPIKQKHHQTAANMARVFRERLTLERYPEMEEPFPSTGFQKVVIWQESGVWFRGMIDALGKHIWDYKSTAASAAPGDWIRNQLFESGLEIQAALYVRGFQAVTGERKHFLFAVQEQDPPYDCYPLTVDPEDLAIANQKITWARDIWARGLATNQWDGYLSRLATAQSPVYLKAKWEEFIENQKTLAKIKETETGNVVDLRAAG